MIETTLKNTYAAAVTAELTTIIKAPSGKVIAHTSLSVELPENGSDIIKQTLEVKAPELWGIKNPALYTAVTEVRSGNQLTDRYETTFGIRTFRWDEATGFYLNGEPTKVLGVCLHHDLGCLGTAVNKRAIERQ